MTLKSILKGFNKTVAQLEKLVARNEAEMVVNQKTIDQLVLNNRALSEEAQQAQAVAAKLRDLIAA